MCSSVVYRQPKIRIHQCSHSWISPKSHRRKIISGTEVPLTHSDTHEGTSHDRTSRPVNPIAAVGNPQRSAILVVGLIIPCVVLNGCSGSAADNGLADLQLVETLRIGEEEDADDIIFGGVSGLIAVDGTGRIFVGEGQDPKVYVFAANGELL